MNKIISKMNETNYGYSFERNFDYITTTEWMSRNWNIGFYFITFYLIVIFGAKQWMKDREPYQLRTTLFFWNLILASFSILGTSRTLPEVVDILREQGFGSSICNNRFVTEVKVSSLWVWLFTLSKVPELLDTVFIVLRKQKLIFLHWYHHITVILFTWYTYSEITSTGRWYCLINYSVHSIMYSYFAIRALNIKLPKIFALFVTTSQIIQMIFGIFVTLYAFYSKSNGNNCMTTYSAIFWGIILYFSYFILFVNFFINSYFKRSNETKVKNKLN